MTWLYSFETTVAKMGMIVRTDIIVTCIIYLLKKCNIMFQNDNHNGNRCKKVVQKLYYLLDSLMML